MSDQKTHDTTPETTSPSASTKLTRRDALKRIALAAAGIAVLPPAVLMSPGEVRADDLESPKERSRTYDRNFDRGYASYLSLGYSSLAPSDYFSYSACLSSYHYRYSG